LGELRPKPEICLIFAASNLIQVAANLRIQNNSPSFGFVKNGG